jgi:hypothetical protein
MRSNPSSIGTPSAKWPLFQFSRESGQRASNLACWHTYRWESVRSGLAATALQESGFASTAEAPWTDTTTRAKRVALTTLEISTPARHGRPHETHFLPAELASLTRQQRSSIWSVTLRCTTSEQPENVRPASLAGDAVSTTVGCGGEPMPIELLHSSATSGNHRRSSAVPQFCAGPPIESVTGPPGSGLTSLGWHPRAVSVL